MLNHRIIRVNLYHNISPYKGRVFIEFLYTMLFINNFNFICRRLHKMNRLFILVLFVCLHPHVSAVHNNLFFARFTFTFDKLIEVSIFLFRQYRTNLVIREKRESIARFQCRLTEGLSAVMNPLFASSVDLGLIREHIILSSSGQLF